MLVSGCSPCGCSSQCCCTRRCTYRLRCVLPPLVVAVAAVGVAVAVAVVVLLVACAHRDPSRPARSRREFSTGDGLLQRFCRVQN